LLYEDETILWRCALPRAGWWRKAQRARLPTRPLSQSQIKREESLKRQAWVRSRSWSCVTSGVLLRVIGAVQYGTSKVFYKIVPHFDAQELRQYLHQVMATFRTTGKEVVMVVDRSGIHRVRWGAGTFRAQRGEGIGKASRAESRPCSLRLTFLSQSETVGDPARMAHDRPQPPDLCVAWGRWCRHGGAPQAPVV